MSPRDQNFPMSKINNHTGHEFGYKITCLGAVIFGMKIKQNGIIIPKHSSTLLLQFGE